MAELEERKYEYHGRVLCVWQFLSDLTYGVVSIDTQKISSYRALKNKDLKRYKDCDEAQAALDGSTPLPLIRGLRRRARWPTLICPV